MWTPKPETAAPESAAVEMRVIMVLCSLIGFIGLSKEAE